MECCKHLKQRNMLFIRLAFPQIDFQWHCWSFLSVCFLFPEHKFQSMKLNLVKNRLKAIFRFVGATNFASVTAALLFCCFAVQLFCCWYLVNMKYLCSKILPDFSSHIFPILPMPLSWKKCSEKSWLVFRLSFSAHHQHLNVSHMPSVHFSLDSARFCCSWCCCCVFFSGIIRLC